MQSVNLRRMLLLTLELIQLKAVSTAAIAIIVRETSVTNEDKDIAMATDIEVTEKGFENLILGYILKKHSCCDALPFNVNIFSAEITEKNVVNIVISKSCICSRVNITSPGCKI